MKGRNGSVVSRVRGLELGSLRTRAALALASFALVAAAAFVVERERTDRSAYFDQETRRIGAVARSASALIDGDTALASRNQLDTTLVKLAAANALRPPLRVLVARKEGVQLERGMVLEVAVTSDPGVETPTEVCSAEIAAMANGELDMVREDDGDRITVATPVRDSFGTVIGIVRAEIPSGRPVSRMLGLALVSFVAIAALGLWTLFATTFMKKHCAALLHLAEGQGELRGVWVSSEMRTLAETMQRLDASVTARTAPSAEDVEELLATGGRAANVFGRTEHWTTVARNERAAAAAAQKAAASSATAAAGAPARDVFDPGLVGEQVIERFRQSAARRNVELRIDVGNRVPETVVGEAAGAAEVLSQLVENAVGHSKDGIVQVRVSRMLDSYHLRFEVVDQGSGVPWMKQPTLHELLEKASVARRASGPRGRAPKQSGLEAASWLAASMGGQLGFESQPGAGSRFWFTMSFEPAGDAATLAPRALAS